MKPASKLLFATLCLLSGCASYQWEKNGGNRPAAATDLEECHELAHLQSAGSPARANRAPATSAPGKGKETMIASHSSVAETPMEMDQENACMEARGYRLVPASH